MTRARAPYMEWAKKRPAASIDLAGSNLLACSLSDLPAAREAIDLSGESPEGYRPLLDSIAARYGVTRDCVAMAGGCSGANFLACAALLDAGDEALVETPNYDPLPAAARMLGASVSAFQRRFDEGYRIVPERVADGIGPRTRLVIISNPHNPSGVLASEEEMAGLTRVAQRAGIRVLVDEVYLDTIFENRPAPAATRSPLFLSTNSLTKSYGLASLRCGWALASPDVTEKIRWARDIVDVWGPIPADRLAHVAFQHIDRLSDRARRIVASNAGLVRSFLDSHPALECIPSQTTIAFPRLRGASDAGPFVSRLLAEYGVAVVPGSFFDAPAHFRIAFGGATEKLEGGLEAISRALENRRE